MRIAITRVVLKQNNRWLVELADGTEAQLTDAQLAEAREDGGVFVPEPEPEPEPDAAEGDGEGAELAAKKPKKSKK